MNTDILNASLTGLFAPWVQALNLRAESFTESAVTLRLPNSAALSRTGGMLCGQAMMAAADTATVLALINHFGQFRPCTTVQMSTSFMRPLSNQDALVTATLVRVGKAIAFAEIDIRGADDGKLACRASTTYALQPG
jgi:uncharacterized protein (TIGR00369 family)